MNTLWRIIFFIKERIWICRGFFYNFDVYQKTLNVRRFFSSSFQVVLAFSVFSLLLLSGCRKQEYEERIVGIWDVVDVTDIDPGQGEVWEMFDNNIDIFRYQIDNPEERWLHDNGKYIIERKGMTMYVKLANLNYSTFNTSWEIFELSQNKLVISIEIPGGIFYKEFVKKTGN